MKVLKGTLFLVFLMLVFVILFVSVSQNANPGTFLGDRVTGLGMNPKVLGVTKYFDYTAYGFNKPSSRDALIVDFSDNDIKYNDSLMSIITKRAEDIPDDLKEWKKTHIIYKKKRYKVKYKFHGSSNFSYKKGRISLKVKSKKYINDAKYFSLITGFGEASFVNIFIALQEHKLDLIAPDPGTIILANVNGKVEDFWFTEDLSDKYLEDNYGFEDYNIFEVSDNYASNGVGHKSELDGFYYYLDAENLETEADKYDRYRKFKQTIDLLEPEDKFPNTDYKYMGRFLANLYFYYGVHHVQGDNNKFLFDFANDIVYPVARNEGVYNKVTDILNFDQGIFDDEKYKSLTTDFYKKAVCNDSIKFYRDIELFKLVQNRDQTLKELDSLYTTYYDYHKHYNLTYMLVKSRYKKMKDVIIHNSDAISKYLNNGEIIIAYDKETNVFKTATDYRVPLKFIDVRNSESFIFNGLELAMQNGDIESSITEKEYTFKNVIDKSQLRIVNMITQDTISNSNIIFNYF